MRAVPRQQQPPLPHGADGIKPLNGRPIGSHDLMIDVYCQTAFRKDDPTPDGPQSMIRATAKSG